MKRVTNKLLNRLAKKMSSTSDNRKVKDLVLTQRLMTRRLVAAQR